MAAGLLLVLLGVALLLRAFPIKARQTGTLTDRILGPSESSSASSNGDGSTPATPPATDDGGGPSPDVDPSLQASFQAGTPTGQLREIPARYASRPGINIDGGLFDGVIAIVNRFGVRVISGHRDPAYNARVGGAQRSDHLCGRAVDFAGTPDQMAALARWAQRQGYGTKRGYVEYDPLGIGDTRDPTDHVDHVHISFVRCGGASAPTPASGSGVLA